MIFLFRIRFRRNKREQRKQNMYVMIIEPGQNQEKAKEMAEAFFKHHMANNVNTPEVMITSIKNVPYLDAHQILSMEGAVLQ